MGIENLISKEEIKSAVESSLKEECKSKPHLMLDVSKRVDGKIILEDYNTVLKKLKKNGIIAYDKTKECYYYLNF